MIYQLQKWKDRQKCLSFFTLHDNFCHMIKVAIDTI